MSEEARYVPDGDPCPKHSLPTRLDVIRGLGFVSTCRGCDDAFLDWFSANHRDIRVAPALPTGGTDYGITESVNPVAYPPRGQLALVL